MTKGRPAINVHIKGDLATYCGAPLSCLATSAMILGVTYLAVKLCEPCVNPTSLASFFFGC